MISQYAQVCNRIINEGKLQSNRTGVDTISIFGAQLRFDLSKEFPAITEKRAFVRGASVELKWMLQGLTNVQYLNDNNVTFWNQWAIRGACNIPTTSTERQRFFNTLGLDITWEQALEDAKSATVPEARVCRLYGIPMVIERDDRIHFQPATNLNAIKVRVMQLLDCTLSAAERLIDEHGLLPINPITSEHLEKILSSLEAASMPIRVTPTEYAVESILMDTTGMSHEAIRDIIGSRPLDEVIEQYKLIGVIPIKTCNKGDLGPVYGHNWRNWKTSTGETIDQISTLVDQIRKTPTSRRHILSFWNVEHLPDERYTPQENVARGKMALAPCHWMCEFTVDLYSDEELRAKIIERAEDVTDGFIERLDDYIKRSGIQSAANAWNVPRGKLNIHPHLRSWDFPAGAPVNLAFYGLFCMQMAQQTSLEPGEMWITGTNVHMYVDQIDIMKEVLERPYVPLPTMELKKGLVFSIFDYPVECYELHDYNPHDAVRVPVAL